MAVQDHLRSVTAAGVPTEVLPRGRNAAPADVVWKSQRRRLLRAMASTVALEGYGDVAVADVIEHAGVSRKTFYEHFINKEQCFLAAYDASVDLMLGAVDEAIASAGADPLIAATAGTRSFLETLSANPAFARTFMIEVLAAGPKALQRRTAVHERFAGQLSAVYDVARVTFDELPLRPAYVFLGCVGAINELVTDHLLRHGPEDLPKLEEAVVSIAVGILVGDERAKRLRARRVSRRKRDPDG